VCVSVRAARQRRVPPRATGAGVRAGRERHSGKRGFDRASAGKAALDTNPTAADVKALPKATDEMDYVLDAMNGECLLHSRHSDWAPVGHRAHWPAPGRRP